MSAATKRKHVAKEIVSDFPPLPDPPNLFVARILAGRGNNLHLVEAAVDENFIRSSSDNPSATTQNDDEKNSDKSTKNLAQFLVSMPVKFRKSFWVKRGDYLLCTPIEEGDKVKAEISRVLYKDDVRYLRQQGRWPIEFEDEKNLENAADKKATNDDMYPNSASSSSLEEEGSVESEEENDGSESVEESSTTGDEPVIDEKRTKK